MRIQIEITNQLMIDKINATFEQGAWKTRSEMARAAIDRFCNEYNSRAIGRRVSSSPRNDRLEDGKLICSRLGGTVDGSTCTYKITSLGEVFSTTALLENLSEEDIAKQNS